MTKLTLVDIDREIERHEATRRLLEHLERSPAPRIPRIPDTRVESLLAYRRHAEAVKALIALVLWLALLALLT